MFVSDFRKEFYEVVQNQVTPPAPIPWTLRPSREEGMKRSGRGRMGGARVRGAALSSLSLPPIEGPSLCGFGRGRPVRLQDPPGATADPGRVGPAREVGA